VPRTSPPIDALYTAPRLRNERKVALIGVDALHLPTYVTTLLTFGAISPKGEVPFRVSTDHRVYDGVAVAKILAKPEENLNGPIVSELRSLAAVKLATLPR
jgi:hypothetical protein